MPPGELPKRLAACKDCKQGVNYGTGSIKELHTGTYQDCCTACAHNGDCLAWDWNSAGGTCYLKDNAKGTAHAQRWSGKMPKKLEDGALAVPASPSPPHGPPAGHPPQSLTKYDDSTWQLVDAPHDMLIHQKLDPTASNKMGYYQRNAGWYRKHFALPAEWKGDSIWVPTSARTRAPPAAGAAA